ncbi:hypothetical protein GCM10027217_13000 [Pseudomaricurvus hydrocarbonicus]
MEAAKTADQVQLNQLKSAFVLNIAKFVRWPDAQLQQRGDQLNLCYYQEDVLGAADDMIRGREVGGRRLQLERIGTPEGLSACDILLLSEAGAERMIKAPLVSRTTPVLVIADMTDHKSTGKVYPGVHVALVRRGNRIGFEINLTAANQAGLKFSSRLLQLARIVGEET